MQVSHWTCAGGPVLAQMHSCTVAYKLVVNETRSSNGMQGLVGHT